MTARWCTLYVDAPDRAVVAATRMLLGPGSDLDVFAAPGFSVEVGRNPDRTGGGHVLDRPTVVEVDAAAEVGEAEAVAFAARLVAHLRAAGHPVAAEGDLADRLR